MDKYAVGKQPCQDLKRKDGGLMYAPDLPNVHACYKCDSTVSFCENCHHDHHANGYDTCGQEAQQGMEGQKC